MGTPSPILVSGATGWVGRSAMAVAHLQRGPADVHAVRLRGGEDLPVPGICPWGLLIHAGFPTQEQVEVVGDCEYRSSVVTLRKALRDIIRMNAPLDLVYLSSGAATSVENGAGVPHRTRVYGQAKIDDEAAYREAIAATGGRLCIVRAFALSGPYMTKPETYALGNMILQALDRGTIEVKATRPVRRSYMAIDDMLRIAMHAVGELDAGESITFETGGEVVEVGELASRVLGVLGCDPEAVTRPPLDPDAPADDYLGDPVLVSELAARAGVVPAGLDEQIAVTAEWLRREVAT